MKVSRIWNSLSWAIVGIVLLSPLVFLVANNLEELLKSGHFDFFAPDPVTTILVYVVFGIMWLLGSACVLASLDQARQYLDDRRMAAMQSDFVSAVSHELRTPLTTIKLYAEMLRADAVPQERRDEFWDGLTHETNRLERLVEDVLSYRRASDADARLAIGTHAVEDLVEDALAATRPVLFNAGMALETDLPPGLAVTVDRTLIVSALVNLLTNAAKYAADGKYVRLEARAEGREVVFTVRDRGPGIPDAERRKVFEPFYRSGSELTRERDGMGLGLALARAAASRHRGRLELATAEGPGAVFHLSVPAGKGRAA